MSNLSQGLIQQGIQQSFINTKIEDIKYLVESGFSLEEAIKLLKINDDIKEEVLAKLK